MKFTVRLVDSEGGFAVTVPDLPGCYSFGDTEAEALDNVVDAIRQHLDVAAEMSTRLGAATPPRVRLAEVEV